MCYTIAMKKDKVVSSVGLILDGNRRWAVKNGLGKLCGHKEGSKTVLKTIDWIKEMGIENVTFYAFSMENWKRSKLEVKTLMLLFEDVFIEQMDVILEKEVSVKFVGSLHKFSRKLQKKMTELEEQTKHYKTKVFFAVSYGGRDEIVQAVKNIGESLGQKEIAKMTEKKFEKYLQSTDVPEPEIIIRTGGDKRLSNFLLWKSAYSELFFIDTLWPDFSKRHLSAIVGKYKKITRVNKGK